MEIVLAGTGIFAIWSSYRCQRDKYFYIAIALSTLLSAYGAYSHLWRNVDFFSSVAIWSSPLVFMLVWLFCSEAYKKLYGKYPEPLGAGSKVGDKSVYQVGHLAISDFVHFFLVLTVWALFMYGSVHVA